MTIAYYITPHGFGHAVRSLEVIRSLLEHEASPEILLVSDLPDFLVEENVRRALPQRRKRLDVGLIQKDSLRIDFDASLTVLEDLHRNSEELIREEVGFLKSRGVRGVVSDIPFLPFHAASRCGIPALGVGNFTWDWIYEAYARTDPRWDPLVAWSREGYRRGDLLLRLPMHGDCSVFPRIEDVPLVARKAARPRGEIRELLGGGGERKIYLISFAALDLDEEALKRLERLDDAVFIFKRPLDFRLSNGRSLDSFGSLSYADVIAAVDAVITKPGYGIVSDCLAHGTPIVYTDRGPFPEYPILVREMERHLTTVYIPSEELYSGNWEPAIHRIQSLPRRAPRLRDDGAAFCARRIMDRLNGERSSERRAV